MAALTEAQLNQLYISYGVGAVWPLRGNLNEALGLYPNSNGTAGAGIAYTTAGPESCRTGNVATFSGASNSFANMGSLAGLGSRIASGGGFFLSVYFKIASGVTAWKIGTEIPTTGPSLWYAAGVSNNQASFTRNSAASNYFDSEIALAAAVRNNVWHAMGWWFNYGTGVVRTYLDAELMSEGATNSTRGTALDGLTTDIANFMLGGFSFNGGGSSAADPFASAFAELSVAFYAPSDERIRQITELGTATFKPASLLPLRNGPRADQVASQFRSNLRTSNPLYIFLGDSMMTQDGFGGVSVPEIRREMNAASGNRLANWEPLRLGDAADSASPPGKKQAITAGSTQKYFISLRTDDLFANDYLAGSDALVRKSYTVDASEGVKFMIAFRKESGGRGPIDYVVRGSDMRYPSAPSTMDGTQNYQTVIATGTALTAEELTGDGTGAAWAYIDIPEAARYRHLQLELTNTGASTANLVDFDVISRANEDGPMVKILARGGYTINSFLANHADMWDWVADLRSFRNASAVHVVLALAANDGNQLTPSAFATGYAAFVEALFATIPDATFTFCTTPPVGGINGNGDGIIHNTRAANMTGAGLAYAEANPGLLINNANTRMEFIRHDGWTPWTQSLARYAEPEEYDAATEYSQGDTFFMPINDAATVTRTFMYRHPTPSSAVQVLNLDKVVEIANYMSTGDMIHHNHHGQRLYAQRIVKAALSGETLFVRRRQMLAR